MRVAAIVLFLVVCAGGAFCAEPASERFDDLVIVDGAQRLPCRIMGIDKDGKVLLRTAFFAGEVRASLQKLVSMVLKRTAVEKGGDVVLLSNGDYLVGVVKDVSPKSVTLESSTLGVVKIPRTATVQVRFGQESDDDSLYSDFAVGDMAPWKPLSGSWRVANGVLSCAGSSPQHIAAPLALDGATTYTFKVNFAASRSVYTTLTLFADNTTNRRGANSVQVAFSYGNHTVTQVVNGRSTRIGGGRIPQNILSKLVGEFRVAYDPRDGRVHVWGDGKLMGKHKLPKPVKKGKFVILQCGRIQKIHTISASPGFSAPLGSPATGGQAALDTVSLCKGETRTGQVRMADGNILIKTAHGDLKYAGKDVAGILFKKSGRQTPKPTARDAIVNLHRSRIRVVPAGMDAETLVGRNSILGNVKLKRAMIARITLPHKAVAPAGSHIVAFKQGPVLRGVVLGAEPDAPLTATFPSLNGAVRLVPDRVARVTLSGTVDEKPGSYMLLVNGDRVFGDLLTVTPENVSLKVAAFGKLDVPLKHVAQVVLAQNLPELSATDFAKGDAKPWRLPAGSRPIKDGVMALAKGTRVTLDHKLEGPMSLELTVAGGGARGLKFSVFIFSDNMQGRNSLKWQINGDKAQLLTVIDDEKKRRVSGRLGVRGRDPKGKVAFTKGKLLFTYNPATQVATLFVNDEFRCGTTLKGAPTTGKHMVILCEDTLSLRGMRLLAGTKSVVKDNDGEPDSHLLLLVGGDRVSLKGVTVADGKATVQLPFGQQTFPLAKAHAFLFSKVGRANVPPGERVVRVRLHRSSLHLVMDSLTDKVLNGTTPYGSKVTMPREAIRSIEF